MKRAAHLQGLIFSVSTVVLSVAIPSALACWLLPSPAQIEGLRARRDELQASVARLEQSGGRIDWQHCGEAGAAVRSRRPRRTFLWRQSRLFRRQGLLSRGLACRDLSIKIPHPPLPSRPSSPPSHSVSSFSCAC